MRYIIHAYPKRMDYVNNYLVPSLQEQGITDIAVKNDHTYLGNLESCMRIFNSLNPDGEAWHLQDDVIICKDFKKRTEEFEGAGVVCGFVWGLDEHLDKVGYVKPEDMWWSFPCIHIPNKIAVECSAWYYSRAKYNPTYAFWTASRRYDDCFFREYLRLFYPDDKVLNLQPCLVDHIDYLIGGTTNITARKDKQVRAQWFEDLDLVEELEKKIGGNDG